MLSQKAWCRGNGSCNTRDAAAACSSASLGPDQAVGEAGAPSWRSALPGGFHLCARRLHSAAAPALLPAQLPTFAASGASIQVAAAQPAEDLLMLLSPWQAGAQALEAVHSASGLPWWASIPLTALAIRAALLPLSLKARAASAGLPLLDTALEQAGALPKQLAAEQSGAALGHTWGRLRLARFVHRYLRQQQRVPSMWWYAGNAAVQTPAFLALTLALKQMARSMWAGMDSEGPLYFTNLTAPPVVWATLDTPYGTAGAMVPLLLAACHYMTLEQSAAARSAKMLAPLQLLTVVPYYCLAVIQPYAVLLYWLTHTASGYALQALTSRAGVAARLRLPPLLAEPASAGDEAERGRLAAAQQSVNELGSDAGFWQALGSRLLADGDKAAAAACFRQVLARDSGHEGARRALADLDDAAAATGEAATPTTHAAPAAAQREQS